MMSIFVKKILLYASILILLVGLSIFINGWIIKAFNFVEIDQTKNKLILGASRTQTAVNDGLIKGYFNNSEAGEPLFYSNIKLRIFKKCNKQIDTVILSLDNRTIVTTGPNRFYGSASIKAKLPRYFHFLTFEDWKKLSSVNLKSSVFASALAPEYTARLIMQVLTKSKEARSLKIGGYKFESHCVTTEMIESIKTPDSIYKYRISAIERQNLMDMVNFCKEHKIVLIFVNPPLHPAMYNSNKYQQGKIVFEEFLKKELPQYTYLNFTNQFLPDSCYADLIHLNNRGAEIFTKKLDSVLKNKHMDAAWKNH